MREINTMLENGMLGVSPRIEKIKKLDLFGKFSKENIKITD